MPAFLEEREAVALACVEAFEAFERIGLHRRFDLAAFPVEAVELARNLLRADGIVGDQAFDAECHVGESSGSVQPRTEHESQVVGRGAARIPTRDLIECLQPDVRAPFANALQALVNDDAIVCVERHDVGHGPQRHEIEQVRKIRFLACGKGVSSAQFGA
jgi:hypothetical protein